MNKINLIIIHCSATRSSMDIGVKDIRRWHMAKGWSDVGYHWVIRRDGTLEQGREESVQGAHALPYNRNSLGICMVGGIHEETFKPENNFTNDQFETLENLLWELTKKYPDSDVKGHGTLPNIPIPKSCPCFPAEEWWNNIINNKEDEEKNVYKYNYILASDKSVILLHGNNIIVGDDKLYLTEIN